MERSALNAVETVRRAARVKAEGELARCERALGRARAELEVAERSHAEQCARRPVLDSVPRVTSALELQRGAAFARRHTESLEQLRAELSARREQLAVLERSLAGARRTLAAALADERAVERERRRIVAAELRDRERAEQDEIDELARGTRQ